jgi:hypothetical protein
MKRIVSIFSCVLVFSSPAMGRPGAGDPALSAEERARVIKLLVDSHRELLEAVEKLTDAQWNYKASPLRWSVGQVVEHIALSEGLLFSAVEQALAAKPNPDWEAKTTGKAEFIERVMPDRSRRAQAPEVIRPGGKLTRAEVMTRLKEGRAKTLKFIEQTRLPMKQHTLDHPFPVFGTLNAYQWLIYIPLHNIRHNKQVAEVIADPGFPK